MSDTILADVKQKCGLPIENEDFDSEIILHANSALSILWQLGTFDGDLRTIDEQSTWNEIETDIELQSLISEYIALKVRVIFDPPQSSTLSEALNHRIDELEFRINAVSDISEE